MDVTSIDGGVFIVAALICVIGAVGVVVSRNPVHAALNLVMTLFGVAVLFVAQGAHFLAAVQVIVYAGAIVVLFLFVIMLLGVDEAENVGEEKLRGQRPLALLLGVLGIVEIFLLTRGEWTTGKEATTASISEGQGTNVEQLAEPLFTKYLLAFEVTSVLLVIAVVGAVVLARRSAGPAPDPEREHSVQTAGDQ